MTYKVSSGTLSLYLPTLTQLSFSQLPRITGKKNQILANSIQPHSIDSMKNLEFMKPTILIMPSSCVYYNKLNAKHLVYYNKLNAELLGYYNKLNNISPTSDTISEGDPLELTSSYLGKLVRLGYNLVKVA